MRRPGTTGEGTPVSSRPVRRYTAAMKPSPAPPTARDARWTPSFNVAGAYRVALYPDAMHEAISPADTPFAIGARGLDAFDATAAMLDGVALPACGTPITESCYIDDVLHLVDVTTASVSAGGATIDVDSPDPVTLAVGVGGAVWGALGAETRPFTPNPDAPSWCPPEEVE